MDKYLWRWKMVCGWEKDVVRFGVTMASRLSVNRRLFSSLSAIMGQGELPGTPEENGV